MSQKLWVAYECGSNRFVDKVSIDGCEDIAEFKGIIDMNIIRFVDEIKKKFPNSLGSFDASQLTLYQPDGITEIKVGDSPAKYLNGNTDENPLIVRSNVIEKGILDYKADIKRSSRNFCH